MKLLVNFKVMAQLVIELTEEHAASTGYCMADQWHDRMGSGNIISSSGTFPQKVSPL